MSAEARMLELIEATVREVTKPVMRAVEELSARLAALEGADGAKSAAPAKRASSGRTARAKAQMAEVSSLTGDGASTESGDYDSETATDDAGDTSEKVPEQRKGAAK